MQYQVHVINLPHRILRRKSFEREASEQGNIEPVFWDGIIHHNTRTGIARAHKQIVRYAKENNIESIIIAEDDCLFTSKNSFQYFIDNVPEKYDLYLSSVYSGHILPGNIVTKFTGLTLYSIHKKFYDKFLSLPEEKNIDCSLTNQGLFIVCNPFVTKQYNGYSDNVKREVNYDAFLKRRKFLTDK